MTAIELKYNDIPIILFSQNHLIVAAIPNLY